MSWPTKPPPAPGDQFEGDWKTGAGGLSPRIAASRPQAGCEGEGVSDDRAELLAGIRAKAVIRGDFVLSSGRRADVYVDLRRVLLAGRVMLDLTADLGYDAVGGLTLGADPVATAMMHAAAARGTPVDAF